MRYFFALPIALILVIPITFAQQSCPFLHVQRGSHVHDTYHSPYLPAFLFRRTDRCAFVRQKVLHTTVRYHRAEADALWHLKRASAIARTPEAHARAAEIRTFACCAIESGHA